MEVDISIYFPDIVQDVREFQEFAKAVNPEFEIARERQEGQLRNQYIMSCDETGIARYERLMGISPMATATLEERRMAVIAGWNSSTPFSERKLIDMLDAICMHDFYLLDLQIVNYRLVVTLELEAKHTRATVEDLLERIVPKNMEIDVKLKGNTYGDLHDWGFTHGELKNTGLTHGEITYTVLRNKKVIGTNLFFTRGAPESIVVSVQDRPFRTGDEIIFTVKVDEFTPEIVLQKRVTQFDNGKAVVEILPEDTQDLPYGKYRYDIRLKTADRQVHTIIKPSDLYIKEEVTMAD